ncbi:phage tail tape measure protein [Pseudomonas piscis]
MSANNASSRLEFILALTDKVTAPLAKVTQGFNDLAEKSEANIKQIGTGVAGLWGSLTGIGASLEPALEVNRALGDLRSLGVAEDALDALNAKALDFSVDYGENAQAFVASAYKIEGAIKGLAGSQLATFTNTSSVLAKATKSDQDVMSEYVGTLYNLQKQQADAMGKSQWVETLGGQTALAVQLFRSSGEQMKDGFKEAGAIATAAGVGLAEQMAVIGSLSSTMEGGDAGGRYKAFFENIENASEKLGMKFTDTNGKVLPMLDILAKLQGKFGDLRGAAANAKLMEAFGGEGAQVIGALAQDTDRLKNGIDQLGRVRGLEQAEKMAQAMVDPWQQFGAAVNALRISFGQVLIPMLQPLMDRLVGIGKTLTRWTKLFPNITRVMGIATLGVLAIIAAMSLLTITVGASRMAWTALITVWKIVQLLNLRTIAGFLLQVASIAIYVASLTLLTTAMGIIRGAMMLWQGVIWLVNVALTANPIGVVVMGIAALVAIVIAAVYYWDEWTGALMNTEAFKWVLEKLQALSAWFDSMGGWSGMARAAWDGIVSIFQKAINGLIEMLNEIPGVNIETRFGDLPAAPKAPELPDQVVPIGVTPMLPQLPGQVASSGFAPKVGTLPLPDSKAVLQVQAQSPLMLPMPVATSAASAPVDQIEQSRQRLSQAAPGLSPERPISVPQGGLLTRIQNTNQSQDRTTRIEKVEIHNSKPMNPLELEQMMAMAVG